MNQEKRKKFGVIIIFLGLVISFLLMFYFGQSGTKIEYQSLSYMLKMFFTYSFAIIGLYFGLYFYANKKIANQIGGGAALFLIVAYILGFLLHH